MLEKGDHDWEYSSPIPILRVLNLKKLHLRVFFAKINKKIYMHKTTILLCQELSICVQLTYRQMRGHNTEATMVASYATINGSSRASPWY